MLYFTLLYVTLGNLFGAVGCVSRLRNPIQAASILAAESGKTDSRLIPPAVLVAEGAELYAERRGISLVDNSWLITENAKQQWHKAKLRIECREEKRFDTVGAISVGT